MTGPYTLITAPAQSIPQPFVFAGHTLTVAFRSGSYGMITGAYNSTAAGTSVSYAAYIASPLSVPPVVRRKPVNDGRMPSVSYRWMG